MDNIKSKSLTKEYQKALEVADQKFNNGFWDDCIDLYEFVKDICSKLGQKDRVQYAEDKIAAAKTNQIVAIRKTVLDLGTKYSRIQIAEISEVCSVQNEKLIISVVNEMIEKKEIYAHYFTVTRSVAFNQQANIDEIDKLMNAYKEWEAKKGQKKD